LESLSAEDFVDQSEVIAATAMAPREMAEVEPSRSP
jgi:hypothetical protein